MSDRQQVLTYQEQPDNVGAWRLGEACSKASTSPGGDYIDLGLGLLKELQAKGYGVVRLPAQPPAQAEPQPAAICDWCQGAGSVTGYGGQGPDLYEIDLDCSRCKGTGEAQAEPSPDTEQPTEPGWRPVGADKCPITGRPFWGNIEHPDMGRVATYGGPFDTYTIPALDEDDELRSERYDHDQGSWIEGGEPIGYFYSDQQPEAEDTEQQRRDAERLKDALHQISLTERDTTSSLAEKVRGMARISRSALAAIEAEGRSS